LNNCIFIENLTITNSTTKKYLLKNFRLELKESTIHALVGASGSGKSTLAFAILNLLPQYFKFTFNTFQIFTNDYSSITDWNSIRGSSIVYIPQNPVDSFHPYINLITQIFDFFNQKEIKITKEDILSNLSSFGIQDVEKKLYLSPFSLSGGERQRVLIAISSMIQPKIIIADEPTTALDSINERLVLKDLIKINKKHLTTILLITHDRRIVRELADEVSVLNNGILMDNFLLKNGLFPDGISEYSKTLLLEKSQ
jgi:ABC-type dipeptide/oligopeptide/nickel transport system ATPase component